MKRLLLFVALTVVVSGGCKKKKDDDAGQYSGGGNPTGYGAEQAVRKNVERTVGAIEMHDLHLFMHDFKGSNGRPPTSTETFNAVKQSGNHKLAQMIQDGLIVLVPNPPEEGLWAYAKEAPTTGGWVVTHSGESRMTPQEFAGLQRH